MILHGLILSPEQRERLVKRTGKDFSEEVWRQQMTGHRMLVCPEPASRTYKGSIFLPSSAVERQKLEMGAGWIIAVGPMAGAQNGILPHPGGLMAEKPEDLLGLHILYRSHQGINIKTSDDDSEFMGDLIVLTDRDALAWDGYL